MTTIYIWWGMGGGDCNNHHVYSRCLRGRGMGRVVMAVTLG